MNDLDKTLNQLDKMDQSEQNVINQAENIINEANRQIEEAHDREVVARFTREKIAVAKNALEDARRTVNAANQTVDGVDGTQNKDNQKKESTKKLLTSVGAILLAGAVFIGGYVLIKQSMSGKIKDDKDSDKSMSDGIQDDVSNSYDNVLVSDDELTEEKFESMIDEYQDKYSDMYTSVSENDITKFGAIANIDLLSEENPEYAKELFGIQTKEEYLGDSANVIGATVNYNFDVWESTFSTKDFIKVSDIIFGEQKDQMIEIEEYTDRIAHAVNANNRDLVNDIVSEFIGELSSGKLSKLDDGVGFAAQQVNIAIIADCIARNYLDRENFDMFQELKTSEKYVSNIFTQYDRCVNDDVKTLTRK